MATVRQSGGDYGSLNAAVAAGETTITIDQAWTVADTTAVTFSTANCTVTVSGAAKHPGYISGGNYYRAQINAADAFDVNANGVVIDGIVLKLTSTGSSDEAIDVQGVTAAFTVRNSLIYANDTRYNNQDGIYVANNNCTINVIQCKIWNFSRGGAHYQNFSGTTTGTLNVNSSVFFNNGRSGESDTNTAGGVVLRRDSASSVITANVYNTIALNNSAATNGDDYKRSVAGLSIVFNISRSIDSDNSIATAISSGANNLASRAVTDSGSPGTGNWVVFENITSYPYDLRLKSNAENDAQDVHATASGHGLTIPSTDIAGTSRPQNTNYDIGAFEIVAGGSPVTYTATTSIDAMIQRAGITQSINIGALLQKTLNASLSVDGALQSTITTSVSVDALVQAALSGALSVDALLQLTQSADVSLDALLQVPGAASVVVDALLQDALSSSASLDAVLTGSSTANVVIDALLQSGQLSTAQLDALLQRSFSSSAAVDALIQSGAISSAQIDAILQRQRSSGLSIDAVITGGSSASLLIDALLQSGQTAPLSVDALLQAGVSVTAVIDALLQSAKAGTVSIDALITGAAGTNASASLDALLQAVNSGALSLDAMLQTGALSSTQIDAILQKTAISAVSVGALIRATLSAQISIDALMQSSASASISLDSLISAERSGVISIDALVIIVGGANLSLDALLLGLRTSALSLDAIVGIVTERIYNGTLASRTQLFGLASRTQLLGLRKLDS